MNSRAGAIDCLPTAAGITRTICRRFVRAGRSSNRGWICGRTLQHAPHPIFSATPLGLLQRWALPMGISDDLGGSEAVDLMLHLFIVSPSVAWCLRSPRINKGKHGTRAGIMCAILLLAGITFARVAFENLEREPNHFEILGVRVDATPAQVKKAYKTVSLVYHPDKRPDDPNARNIYLKIQKAYEVLKDSGQRDKYNKFGQRGLDSDASASWTNLLIFYVIWCAKCLCPHVHWRCCWCACMLCCVLHAGR